MQAQYAPEAKRRAQLDACDQLIRLLEPDKEYPYDFVRYRLTDYHPRPSADDAKIIPYNDLMADIPAYAAELSRPLRQRSSDISQKIYTLADLAQKFHVSTKTVTRWRVKGLVGRYLVFPDGRQRLAFLGPTVEHFRRKNRRVLRQRKQFSRVSTAERTDIIRYLTRLAQRCPERRQDAIRRAARHFQRSVEGVRQILATEERAVPVFRRRQGGVALDEQQRICADHDGGASVEELMKRFARGRSTIYRVLRAAQAQRLRSLEIKYMPCPDFALPGAEKRFCVPPADLSIPHDSDVAGSPGSALRAPLDSYAADIMRTPLLNQRQEQFLFAKYNCLKYLAAQLQPQIDPVYPSAAIVENMQRLVTEADRLRDRLIRSNLRLVVSVARKHVSSDSQMLDLISEGNLAIMNAVEKFDFKRGVKFSTYATWAVVRRFASLYRAPTPPAAETLHAEVLETADNLRLVDSKVQAVESARKSLEQVMTETLDEREQAIVRQHYGLTDKTELIGQRKPKSLREIAEMIGLSKEGIRRVELVALQKLRRVLSREQFDLLTAY